MNDKNILFRCDADEDIGMGHLTRCLSIAKKIKPNKICFAVNDDPSNKYIKNNGFELFLKNGSQSEEEFLEEAGSKIKPYAIVIDKPHRYSANYLKNLKKNNAKIIFIDNLCEGIDCADENIFPSINIDGNALKKYLSEEKIKKIKTGLDFVIIRDEIFDLKNKIKPAPNTRISIAVATGGSDPKGILIKTADFLKNMNLDSDIFLLEGEYFKLKKQLDKLKRDLPENFHILPHSPENLMKGNICICKFGVSIYELIYLQIPNVCISHAKEDVAYAEKLQELELTKHIGYADEFTKNDLQNELQRFLKDGNYYKNRIEKLKNKIDGKGAKRIAGIITGEYHAD